MSPAVTTSFPWRFDGTLRHYQADVLARVDVNGSTPLHIVAPPGSGKTLLGLLLVARRGRRAVVLAPTVTIREQWIRQAASLTTADAVSQNPESPGDLTALTYQALSVLDTANPLAGLARTRWSDELTADGHDAGSADAWLGDLETSNPAAYRRGISRRSRTLRKQLVREDPDTLAAALHPNARALIDRLVAHGVETIVLDECHHLLDHWALVVAAFAARIRAAGREPLLVGLTATLPSPDDADEYDNYTSLLGEVDYEVPVPAVVREGNLAPYRDLVRFVEPTREERAFLDAHADALDVLLRTTFSGDTGLAFLVGALQPVPEPPAEPSALEPPAAPVRESDEIDARLASAFAEDFAGSEAAAAMLATVAPQHPLVPHLPAAASRPASTDQSLRLLARFALQRLLPEPAAAPRWDRIRRTLADFGYALTDRGVRRTRDPVDTMLASSLAKDHAACDILRLERSALGDDRLRALVVTDFAEHGNTHGGLVGTAGALRTFGVLAADASTVGLRAMLVTGSRARVSTRDADRLVRALGAVLDAPVAAAPLLDAPHVSEVHAPGVSSAVLVRAVAVLLTRGDLHVVVGTRGLFGEGWDCPAVNTLIDLTSVATASATQQLRGRTLRLDPAWPEKVAHNWTVTALLPPSSAVAAAPDAARLRRKHERLWGLDVDEPSRIVRGLSGAMSGLQRDRLESALRGEGAVDSVNDALVLPPRAATRAEWRIGDEYTDAEGVSTLVARRRSAPVFRTSVSSGRALGAAVGVLSAGSAVLFAIAWVVGAPWISALLAIGAVWFGVPLWQEWRRARAFRAGRADAYGRIGAVVWESLRRAGRVADEPGAISVWPTDADVSVTVAGAALADQRIFAEALRELFGPVRTPRFLLETGRGGQSWVVRAILRSARRGGAHYLPVPTMIGRRQADASAFAAAWNREVGACTLHPMDHPARLALMAQARRAGGRDAAVATVREEWR